MGNMTLREAYEFGQRQLSQAGIDDAAVDAWYLLEYVTGISRALYFLEMQKRMSAEQEEKYLEYIQIRASHIPLQHITGVQEFMGLEFEVNEHVLVPRQDTEVLVESVIKSLRAKSDGLAKNAYLVSVGDSAKRKILDMCTGSGCILISLLKFCKDLEGTGVDISEEALKVAKKNCEKIGVKANLLQSNLFENVTGKYDVIVSNPPYIRTSVIEELKEEVKLHDPFIALDGKEDGLYFYREIVGKSSQFLQDGGKLFFEIGHDQGEDVKRLMEEAGFSEVFVKKDLAGLDRVVSGRYNI